MENSGFTRNTPLSYDARKAVVKSLKLEIRESINSCIPSLRVINSQFPYQLDNLQMQKNYIRINDRQWFFRPIEVEGDNDDDVNDILDIQAPEYIPNVCDVKMCLLELKGPQRRLEKSPEAAFQQVFDAYIGNGTRIKSLLVRHVPEFLAEKNSEDLCLKVQNLKITLRDPEDHERFIPFIDLGVVRSVGPRNAHLAGFSFIELKKLVEGWIADGKRIGSRFSWGQNDYDAVMDIFKMFEEKMGAVPWKHPRLSTSYLGHGVKLSMGANRDLVMFGGSGKKDTTYVPWTFEMEVMAVAGTVPSEDA